MRRAMPFACTLLVALALAVPADAAAPLRLSHAPLAGRAPDAQTVAVPASKRRATNAPSVQPGSAVASHPLRAQDPQKLAAAKQRAALTAISAHPAHDPAAPQSSSPAPRAVVHNGLNKPGLAAQDSTPPDSTGSIGPHDYIEMVNTLIGLYSRDDLTLTASRTLGDFIGFPTDDVFDPQIQWDEQAQRYLFVMDDVVGADNFLALGWSKDDDPDNLTTDWCVLFAAFDLSEFEDYPKLGHNDTSIIIGTNVFDGNTFVTSRIWAIEKPANGVNTCPTGDISATIWGSSGDPLLTGDNQMAFTPVPANTFGASANGYVVAADFETGQSELTLWNVTGPGNDPALSAATNITVSTYDVPPNIPQPGTSRLLDSLDGRLTQAVAMPDPDASSAMAVWTQHTVAASDGRTMVRWYEILPTAVTMLRQEGNIDIAGLFAFNGAISPAASGNEAIVNYNTGSASALVQIRAQSRTSSTTLSTMEGEITLGTSSTYDRDFSCGGEGPCRWGDYAGASPDPIDTSVVWGSNQANGPFNADPHWLTRNFALSAVLPPDDGTPPVVGTPQRAIVAPQVLGSTALINVSWPDAADDSGIILYELQKKKGSGSFNNVTLGSPTDTSVNVTVTVGTNYKFRVRATDGANNTGPWTSTSSAHMTLFQENAGAVSYTSGWKRVSLSGSSGGRVKKAGLANKTATFTFSGAGAALVTTRGSNRGILRVRVDGGPWQIVDLYRSSLQTKYVAYAVAGLGGGSHTIDVLVVGSGNASSSGTRIDIDAFLTQP